MSFGDDDMRADEARTGTTMAAGPAPTPPAAPVPLVRDLPAYYGERERREDADMRHRMRDHVATYRAVGDGEDRVELLTWAKPGTGAYLVRYMTHGSRLYIAGDMGSGVYNRAAGLAWWSDIYPNFRYFTEKCEASGEGRDAREFDAEAVRDAVRDHFVALARAARGGDDRDRERFRARRRAWRDLDGERYTDDRHDWVEWLRNNGAEVFGEDWWDSSALTGMVIAYRARFHLLGLHLAMAQLRASGEMTPGGAS